MLEVTALRVEYHDRPLGLDCPRPRLAWRVTSPTRGDHQTAWQVQAASSLEALLAGDADLWDSGQVAGGQTTQVAWGGAPLGSRAQVHWRVQAWDVDGVASGFCEPAYFTLGLLDPADWQAQAIGAPGPAPAELVRPELMLVGCRWHWLADAPDATADEPCQAVFRHRLKLPADRRLARAELLLTAAPAFKLAVNGQLVGESDAPPDTYIRGKLFDITAALGPGENVLAVEVAGGGERAGLIGRWRIELEGGSRLEGTIDDTWRAAAGVGAAWASFDLDDYAWPAPTAIAEYAQPPFQCHPFQLPATPQPCPYLRRAFSVERPLRRATVYVTALGLFELRLNGGKVGRDLLRPGWTDYNLRLPYSTYDVTAAIRPGENVLGTILGDGWYAGHVAFMEGWWGKVPRLICQLELEYEDGSRETIVSDDQWRAGWGPELYSDLLHGEYYDARRTNGAWDQPGAAPDGWLPVAVEPRPEVPLVWSAAGPVQRQTEFATQTVSQPKPGLWLFDLGQNIVGWARLRLNAPAGTRVRATFAEMVNPDGTPYLTNLRTARALDTYVCAGRPNETWEPRFTFHGFRYVALEGLPSAPGADAVTGIVLHNPLEQTGEFACSDPLLNQLQHNIEWGTRGNHLEVPTDCPQRDERLGWTGDAQVFARTACFNFDMAGFYTKWLTDLLDAVEPSGKVPDVAPRMAMGGPSAAWADAIIICPWVVYQCYGDRDLLARCYPAMVRWLEWQTAHSTDGVRPPGGYGDWLQMDCTTPTEVIQTAWYAHGAALVARVAEALDRPAEAAAHRALAERIAAAFRGAFVGADGVIHGDTQCAYALALAFDLLPAADRPRAAALLAERVRERDVHIATGFVGTPYMCATLADHGYLDLAYQLLRNDSYPSWGYSIRHGATTVWERWDGWTDAGGFQTPAMNSFNHYAYGAIGDWMARVVAGLDTHPDHPGYQHLRLAPRPGGGLTWARAALLTPHGRASCHWELEPCGALTLTVEVPTNATAEVIVPTDVPDRVEADPAARQTGPGRYEVGSGQWQFRAPA